MADEPKMTQRFPYVVQEEEGSKWWCACGKSENQPYCDGSHKGSGITPIKVDFEEAKRVAWCGCRQSAKKPFCDGSHSRLPS